MGQKAFDLIVKRLSSAIVQVLDSNSVMPFNEIYENYKNIRGSLLNFTKTLNIYGIRDKKEGLKYLSWLIFKHGKHDPNYKDDEKDN